MLLPIAPPYAPPSFDAVGGGAIQVTTAQSSPYTPPSWSHNAAAGAYVVAAVIVSIQNSGTTQPTVTATYGGTSMSVLGTPLWDSGVGYLMAFLGLSNVATGSKTVSTTITGSGDTFFVLANTLSYTNVTSVGTPAGVQSTTGTSLSQSIASAPGHMVVQMFNANGTLSAYNKNIRWNEYADGVVFGDAAGASSVSFTATQSASGNWTSYAMDLI